MRRGWSVRGMEGFFSCACAADVPEGGGIRTTNMIKSIKLKDYVKQYGDNWADEMPVNCPPEDVCTADSDVFYRFTKEADVIGPRDWINYRNLYPNRQWTKEEIIFAAGLSLFDSPDRFLRERKLPGVKKRPWKGLAKISLIPADGVVLQTMSAHHYTWWRTTMCNLAKAELV